MFMKNLSYVAVGVIAILLNNAIFATEACETKQVVEDSAITAKVKSKILAEDELSVFKIEVKTDNGIVKLSGEVNSEQGFYDAIELAHSLDGVQDVDASNLKVVSKSQHPIDDSIITAKVKGILLREKIFGDKAVKLLGIKVVTKNGVVRLSGKADNKEQMHNIEKVTKQVKGVKEVVNDIS